MNGQRGTMRSPRATASSTAVSASREPMPLAAQRGFDLGVREDHLAGLLAVRGEARAVIALARLPALTAASC